MGMGMGLGLLMAAACGSHKETPGAGSGGGGGDMDGGASGGGAGGGGGGVTGADMDAPAATGGAGAIGDSSSVLQRNNHASRDGHYVQPTLTRAVAATLVLDTSFQPTITGNVYAQPLYVEQGPGGRGVFVVVTEGNNVHAVAETDGATLWTRNLGQPAAATGAGCGNIAPDGITGTPVIDLAARTIYLAAVIGNGTTILRHEIHALSLDDGSPRAGFPFDPSTVKYGDTPFVAWLQNQRGALSLVRGTLYVPYGGHGGDCGDYRGWVIAVPLANPSGASAFFTTARGGGIWAPGGLVSDDTHVWAATGNTFGATTWGRGEAIIRLQAGAVFSGDKTDYFTPSNWKALDGADADVGGTGPLLVDVPGATPSALVVALAKNGVAYLLDRNNLGGLGTGNGITGEGLDSKKVATADIVNAPATYTTAAGTYVVLRAVRPGSAAGCPAGQAGDLMGLKITATAPPTITVAWCANNQGQGSPIVTTTDGKSEAVVWTVGAESSQRLHGFDGDTGAVVYAGGGAGDILPKLVRRFTSPIAVKGRIVAATDNGLFAFKAP